MIAWVSEKLNAQLQMINGLCRVWVLAPIRKVEEPPAYVTSPNRTGGGGGGQMRRGTCRMP